MYFEWQKEQLREYLKHKARDAKLTYKFRYRVDNNLDKERDRYEFFREDGSCCSIVAIFWNKTNNTIGELKERVWEAVEEGLKNGYCLSTDDADEDCLYPRSMLGEYIKQDIEMTEQIVNFYSSDEWRKMKQMFITSGRQNGKTKCLADAYKQLINRRFGVPSMIPDIEDVIFNGPATIVFWKDGTKTVVKAQDDDEFDPEKGLAMAISKKALGNNRDYYKVFQKRCGKYWKDLAKAEKEAEDFSACLRKLQKVCTHTAAEAVENANKNLKNAFKKTEKMSPVEKAYNHLIQSRDYNAPIDIDAVIGLLGEVLDN